MQQSIKISISMLLIFHANFHTTRLFYQQRFYSTQPLGCLTFSWFELQMLLKCCLIHISIISILKARYILYLLYLLGLSLFMSYLYDLFFIFRSHFHVSWKQIIFRFQKFSLRVLLSFCLICHQFQPGVAYKSVAYKKACNQKFL